MYVSLAFFWELYDLSLAMSALSHIAREFEIERSHLAYATSFIRFGAFPALLIAPLADKFGRKIVFLAAVVGLSISTCATAFCSGVYSYVAFQMVCRCCVELCSSTGFVIASEELPAEHRGWGMGVLGATGAFGFGLGALLFAAVDVLPYRWRFLYFVGILPIFLLPTLIREIPETRRFRKMQSQGTVPRTTAVSLLLTHTSRVLAVVAASFSFSCGNTGVFQFSGFYVLGVKMWQPWQLSTLVICAGSLGVFGNVAVGRLGDTKGRKPVACTLSLLYPLFATLFYHSESVLLAVSWAALTLCSVVMSVLMRTLSTEVFPTESRSTAGGLVSGANAFGSVVGLSMIGRGTAQGYEMPDVVCKKIF